MLICDKHKRDRIPAFACPACLLDERNRLRAENEELREAARELIVAMTALKFAGVPIVNYDTRTKAATGALNTALTAHDLGEKQ